MTYYLLDRLRDLRRRLPGPPGRVLEVGARNVNGSARCVFGRDAAEYVGADLEGGPGVDLVCDAEALGGHFPAGSFDTALCFETLEHCVRPWAVADRLIALLRPGGLLWVSAPTFGHPLHRHPVDCYRFGEDAFRGWLFAGMEVLELGRVNEPPGYPCLVGVARK